MFYSPGKIAERYPKMAQGKCTAGASATFVKGILAGAFVALATLGAHTISVLIADAGIAKICASLLFPAGLAMVLLAGGELFTGNCMIVLGVFHGEVKPSALLKNWALVYFGNFVGAIIIAALTVLARSNDTALLSVAISAAEAKAALPWGEAFFRAILCNILVCAGVWMSYSSDDSSAKLLAMYSPVVLFVLCGTEHCVANMYYFTTAFFAGGSPAITLSGFLLGNLVPVTLGNIIGGSVLFSGALWFALFNKKA